MQTSIFLARLIGPVLVVVGIAMLANRDHFRGIAEEALRSTALTYIAGVLGLFAGLAVVLTHNVWTADWRVLITLLGWLAILRGATRILLPVQTEGLGRKILAQPNALTGSLIVILVIGAVLTFFGYVR